MDNIDNQLNILLTSIFDQLRNVNDNIYPNFKPNGIINDQFVIDTVTMLLTTGQYREELTEDERNLLDDAIVQLNMFPPPPQLVRAGKRKYKKTNKRKNKRSNKKSKRKSKRKTKRNKH